MHDQSLTVPRSLEAVRLARDFVGRQCVAAGVDTDAREAAVLLTSEVVTNALLHGRSAARVTVTVRRGRLRVEVGDASTTAPVVLDHGPEAVHGRGLAIVDALSAGWGTRADPHGKIVWFELDIRPADTADHRCGTGRGVSSDA